MKNSKKHINILVYATTLGADLLSAVRYLEDQPDVTIKILLKEPTVFLGEPIFKINPIRSEIIQTKVRHHLFGIPGFKPDLTIMDNHLPWLKSSPKALMLWHGFGWKGPNDEVELKWLHRDIWKNWGSAKKPNSKFRWQCFGPHDFEHRSQVSAIHPENCVQLGAMSHDELRTSIDKSIAQEYYPFDIIKKKTILFAPTWHYGEVFAHWGTDEAILKNLFDYTSQLGVNIILRFHDSFRFSDEYIEKLRGVEQAYDHIMLKFKDKNPDNYLDLQISDVLLTNYSSIVNLYYATGRPSIHIYPVKSEDERFLWRTLTLTGVKTKEIESVRFIWKFEPEDNGGLLVRSFDELKNALHKALNNPNCCKEKSEAFLEKHMMGADGKNRERLYNFIKEFVHG